MCFKSTRSHRASSSFPVFIVLVDMWGEKGGHGSILISPGYLVHGLHMSQASKMMCEGQRNDFCCPFAFRRARKCELYFSWHIHQHIRGTSGTYEEQFENFLFSLFWPRTSFLRLCSPVFVSLLPVEGFAPAPGCVVVTLRRPPVYRLIRLKAGVKQSCWWWRRKINSFIVGGLFFTSVTVAG